MEGKMEDVKCERRTRVRLFSHVVDISSGVRCIADKDSVTAGVGDSAAVRLVVERIELDERRRMG